jgi:hypothetical protein
LFFIFCSDLALVDSKVSLKRDVVEEMLIQRFKNRIHDVSDEELAQITERLLAEQATFPTDLLLISKQQSKQQTAPAPAVRKVTIDASKPSEQELELEEDDDDTAELLATLTNAAAEGVGSAAASSVSDAITSSWTPQIPKIAKAVCIGAGLAATVPAASALQRKYAEKKNENINDKPASPSPPPLQKEEESSGGGGIGGFLSWVFGDDIPGTQPETTSSTSPAPSVGYASTSTSGSMSTPQREEMDAPSTSDQVLWRKKDDIEDGGVQQSYASNETTTSNNSNSSGAGAVLWRRNEERISKKVVNGSSSDQQQDLWRVPIESLKSSGDTDDVEERPRLPQKPKIAPSPRPVPVVEKSKIVNASFSAGVGPPKLSESALDNAEPPDFVANGSINK